MKTTEPRLIVHGGAWSIPDALDVAHLTGVKNAVKKAYPILLDGGSALDAVEAAVRVLEEDPTFDAGRGAFLNAVGKIELDAIIADGKKIDFGAVAAVSGILHPVTLARKILEQSEHCFLVGDGALSFAKSQGMEEVPVEALLTDRELEFYARIKHDPDFKPHHPFQPMPFDTVGAVAMDSNGHLAAATSTGGTPRKLPGRVGDSPVFGSGAYADDTLGAASSTGWGEAIMRSLLAFRVCQDFKQFPPEKAVSNALEHLHRISEGYAGIIGITASGDYAFGHITKKMACAYMDHSGIIRSGLKH